MDSACGATALRDSEEALALAQRSGDDLALDLARCTRGIALVYQDRPEPEAGLALLAEVREDILRNRFSYAMLGFIGVLTATAKAAAETLKRHRIVTGGHRRPIPHGRGHLADSHRCLSGIASATRRQW